MTKTFCALLVCIFAGLNAHAMSVGCSTKNNMGSEADDGPTFLYEDGVMKLIDFQGTVSYPYEDGVLCGVSIRKATGDTTVEQNDNSGLLNLKVDLAGYIVDTKSATKTLASTGNLEISKTTGEGTFSCAYNEEVLISYLLKNCAFQH